MTKNKFSSRAKILKRVLNWFDRNSFHDFGEFMVLGNIGVSWTGDMEDPEDLQIYLRTDVPKTEESQVWDEIDKAFSELSVDFDKADAREYVGERTSLVKPPRRTLESTLEQWAAVRKKLSPEAADVLRKRLEDWASDIRVRGLPEVPARQDVSAIDKRIDLLDLYYSRQVLVKLETIVRRVSSLESVETPKIPIESVEKYFKEAHQCFLYGFHIATAVLCRAVLAAQLDELRDRLDPEGKLKHGVEKAPPGKKLSEYKLLLNRAAAEGLLEEERPLLGRARRPHWAEEIIEAGNFAIHDLDKFNKQYGGDKGADRVSSLLDITRKALLQLHGEFR